MISPRWLGVLCCALVTLCASLTAQAADLGTVRLGVLKFGTVSWELDTIKHHGLDQAEGFTLEVTGFGGGDASNVALLGGEVDMIVDDWLWVSRERALGHGLTFIPYSRQVGGLVVRADSGIASLADLEGKTLGIAGGPLDKSWLLMRATATQAHGVDLDATVEKAFGAPPLLSQKFVDGELDGVLNYWHFTARLIAAGHTEVMSVEDAMRQLGVGVSAPQLGYVFFEAWGNANPELVQAFARASRAAKTILAESDEEWERLRELTRAEDDATLAALRDRFRAGIIESWGDSERADAEALYALLAELGGEKLVGPGKTLSPGTFWDDLRY